MQNYFPEIILNPNKIDYSFNDEEIEFFKEAKKDLLSKNYSFAIKAINKTIKNNLLRRINSFGNDKFINFLEEDGQTIYYKKDASLSEKLNLLNLQILIKTSLKLSIINEKTYTVLSFFYWFSKEVRTGSLSYEDIVASLTLLDKNFFRLKIENKKETIYKKPEEIQKIKVKKTTKLNLDQTYTTIEKTPSEDSQTKRIGKADLLLMQKYSEYQRRKNDLLNDSSQTQRRRRKTDFINPTSFKRRKTDTQ